MNQHNMVIHFINHTDNQIVCKQYVSHVPREGETIRIGRVMEHFYRVVNVVWVYDEEGAPFQRVNIGVVEA